MMNRVIGPRLLVILVAMGCATHDAAHQTGGVPNEVFPALCERFIDSEDLDPSIRIVVLAETRPIFATFALRTMHDAGELTPAEALQDDARDEELAEDFRPAPVAPPAPDRRCSWSYEHRPATDYAGTNEVVLELSNPIDDPFSESSQAQSGVFARLSSGLVSGASWYWVGLRRTGETWEVDSVSPLEISDG